ncbi:MAG: peptidyl-tRNA hydrolase Pth2 [Candidatus Nanoarchaeia archaeon]
MLKQVLVLRRDLAISAGKSAAQAAHAAVSGALKSDPKVVSRWIKEGAKKVVLSVNSEADLLKLYKAAKNAKLVCVLIADAGLTEVKPGTKTALGIGPADEKKIDKITGELPLF